MPTRTVILDTCLRQVYKINGKRIEKRKRRPAGMTPDECRWILPCADHPGQHTHVLNTAGEAVPRKDLQLNKG